MEKLYEDLGLTIATPQEVVRKTFLKVILTCHPDKCGNDPEKAATFRKIESAYRVLRHPEQVIKKVSRY